MRVTHASNRPQVFLFPDVEGHIHQGELFGGVSGQLLALEFLLQPIGSRLSGVECTGYEVGKHGRVLALAFGGSLLFALAVGDPSLDCRYVCSSSSCAVSLLVLLDGVFRCERSILPNISLVGLVVASPTLHWSKRMSWGLDLRHEP